MNIPLTENYRLVTDKHNFILQEKKVTDPNHHLAKSEVSQEIWKDVGYFAKIDHLISYLLNKEINSSGVTTLTELSDFIEESVMKITSCLKKELEVRKDAQ